MRTYTRHSHRPGFTLVELLFVIVIIAVLIALSAAAILKFVDLGPYSATVSNMKKIKGAIDTQWKAIRDKADKEPLPTTTAELSQLKTLAGVPPTTNLADPRLRETYIQLKLAQAFPTDFSEALNPCNVAPAMIATAPVKPWSGYVNYLTTLNVTLANAATAATLERQQAICLLMALEHGPSQTGLSADALGTSAVQRYAVLTTNAFGCADAWGNPLRFARGALVPAPLPTPPPALISAGPAILSYGKDGKPGYLPAPPYPSNTLNWRPDPDKSNDDISSLNY